MARTIRFSVRVNQAEAAELLAGRPPGMSIRAYLLMRQRLLGLLAAELARYPGHSKGFLS